MARNLLNLPGEIRNKIYEYALTEDDDIYYREDEQGAAWLCLYQNDDEPASECETPQPASDEEWETEEEWESEDEAVDSYEQGTRSGHSVETGEGTSARQQCADGDNMGDAEEHSQQDSMAGVGSTEQLEAHGTDSLVRVLNSGHIVANQLQYVCRRLRNETRALGLQYNPIVFSGIEDQEAALNCIRFELHLAAKYKRVLSTLIVEHNGPVYQAPFKPLLKICIQNPQMQIHFRCNLTIKKPYHLMVTAHFFQKYLGKSVPSFGSLTHEIRDFLAGVEVISGIRPEFTSPSNFLTFGTHKATFEEDKFCKIIENDSFLGSLSLPTPWEAMETLVAFVKTFIEKGL